MKMHIGELDLDLFAIQNMVHQHYPASKDLIFHETDLGGTQNHIFKLGDDLYLRLPRMEGDTQILTETKWMEYIRPHVSFPLPIPVYVGLSSESYPAVWAIYRWLPGETITSLSVEEQDRLSDALADFIQSLHQLPVPEDAPSAGRKPINELASHIRECIQECAPYFSKEECAQMQTVLEEGLAASPWNGERVLIHADLLPTNLLVRDGKLEAILDFGSFGAGDPAFDLLPAWAILDSPLRFKERMAPSEDEWNRSKTYAMYQALMIIPYYEESYPEFTAMAIRTIKRILKYPG